jgi:hypothetical protein
MMHNTRIWCIRPVATAEELAEKLTQSTWCCCTGFELGGYVWLNDAMCEDGAQEYAVVRKPTDADPNYRQVESITASWRSQELLLRYIRDVQSGTPAIHCVPGSIVPVTSLADIADALGADHRPANFIVHPTLETPEHHGRCRYCA